MACTREVSEEEVCNDNLLDDPGRMKVIVDKTGGSKSPISDRKGGKKHKALLSSSGKARTDGHVVSSVGLGIWHSHAKREFNGQGKFTWYVFPEISTVVFKILPLEVVSQ